MVPRGAGRTRSLCSGSLNVSIPGESEWRATRWGIGRRHGIHEIPLEMRETGKPGNRARPWINLADRGIRVWNLSRSPELGGGGVRERKLGPDGH